MPTPRSTRAGTRRAISVGAYTLVYAMALLVLAREPGASVFEPLFVLVVLGIAFPLLALLLTRRNAPRPDAITRPRAEAGHQWRPASRGESTHRVSDERSANGHPGPFQR